MDGYNVLGGYNVLDNITHVGAFQKQAPIDVLLTSVFVGWKIFWVTSFSKLPSLKAT